MSKWYTLLISCYILDQNFFAKGFVVQSCLGPLGANPSVKFNALFWILYLSCISNHVACTKAFHCVLPVAERVWKV